MGHAEEAYKLKKVMTIGTVCEITGLSERKVRYYEERQLVSPARTGKGTRKYSFVDIEHLMEIANQIEEGTPTLEIRKDLDRRKRQKSPEKMKKDMIRGQINAHFKNL